MLAVSMECRVATSSGVEVSAMVGTGVLVGGRVTVVVATASVGSGVMETFAIQPWLIPNIIKIAKVILSRDFERMGFYLVLYYS